MNNHFFTKGVYISNHIIDDSYLILVKLYNKDIKNKRYNFLNDVKNYENYIFYFNIIYNIKNKLKNYEILTHHYCIRKHINIYNNWRRIIKNKI